MCEHELLGEIEESEAHVTSEAKRALCDMTMWKVLNGFYPKNIGIQFKYSKRNGMIAKLPQLTNSCKSEYQTMHDSSFAVLGPKLWNLLPASVTLVNDIYIFKVEFYRKFLYEIPDKPPVKGYPCANNTSLLE